MSCASPRLTRSVLGVGLAELLSWCKERGLPKMRARQAFDYLYGQCGTDWRHCSSFDAAAKDAFIEHWPLDVGTLIDERVSHDGTVKWLREFGPGLRIESVMIPEATRTTLCISSQVGCSLSCSFCHTGTQRLLRNLHSTEILAQLHAARRRLRDAQFMAKAVDNVVFMGQGEPLYNYRNVRTAAQFMVDSMGLGRGKVTISTSGIAPLIPKVAAEIGVQLAVSLHAPNNDLRSQIMSINRTYPIESLMEASRLFVAKAASARKRITYEYVMLDGVNDSPELAWELGALLKPLRPAAHVNLIPFNEWPGAPYLCSPKGRIRAFGEVLTERFRIPTTIRAARGEGTTATCAAGSHVDIMAACGQLQSQQRQIIK